MLGPALEALKMPWAVRLPLQSTYLHVFKAQPLLQAKYGYRVTVCESHYHPGGCAHGFEIKSKKGGIFKFDAGPSLWAGMNQPSTNPLRQV